MGNRGIILFGLINKISVQLYNPPPLSVDLIFLFPTHVLGNVFPYECRVIMVTTKFNIRNNMSFLYLGVWGLAPKYNLSIPKKWWGIVKVSPRWGHKIGFTIKFFIK